MHFFPPLTPALTLALNTLHSITAPPVPSTGCGNPLPEGLFPGGPSVNFTIFAPEGSGGQRRYLLHLPERFDLRNRTPKPLLVVFHAFGQTTTSIEDMSGFSDDTVNGDMVVVYPEGINNTWQGDPSSPPTPTLDDRPYIHTLLLHLHSTLCLDTSRVYATGFSNGGGLAGLLACYPPTSRLIAAFAGVSAAYYTTESLGEDIFENGCRVEEGRRMPMLSIHGSKDDVVAYDGDNSGVDWDGDGRGDPDTVPIPRWLSEWGGRNGCQGVKGNLTLEADISMNWHIATGDVVNATMVLENGSVRKSTWTCRGWSGVVTGYYVAGLGHGWPSTVALDEGWEGMRGGPSSWNASSVLLEWFKKWSLGGDRRWG
ncbi:carbohydrate esterase family 1 protein [Sporormia fimetaria CBS 119925]|uniref:feruloyl esterase n=1 Tax=Sporormia fimetaria CBS 119925 TaxID=1340428 RepID=A0A6A6UZK8_9PLEO|nr:carbohydrate esterase family 1 protein [Sporormia fimetaria CBS 119925]